MKIIDAHHHLWIPDQTEPDIGYGWLRDIGAMKPFGDPTSIQRDYEWPEFVNESTEHELMGTVFLQCDGALPDPVRETQWVTEVFSASNLLHSIISFIDLNSASAADELKKHAQSPLFKGVRQIVSRLDDHPPLCFANQHYLRSPLWRENLSLLAQLELSVDLQLYPEQMNEAAAVFSSIPELPVIIDHAGSPWDNTDAGFVRWQEGVEALAELPNCVMKLSGFGMFDQQWSAVSIQSMITVCLKAFGSKRIMFGSNYPVDKLMASYDDVVNRVAKSLTLASQELALDEVRVLDDVFVNTAQRVYRLS